MGDIPVGQMDDHYIDQVSLLLLLSMQIGKEFKIMLKLLQYEERG